MRRMPAFDMPLFVSFLLLVGLGITFVFTASYPKALSLEGNSLFFAGRQIIFAVVGLLGMFACMYIPLPVFRRFTPAIGMAMLALLVLVLVIGSKKHGNQAWIPIGSFQFQPSEFAKVVLVLALASYLAKHPWSVKTLKGLLTGPYLYLGIPLLFIILQGDLGTAIVFALAGIILIAAAGAKFRYTGLPVVVVIGLVGVLVLAQFAIDLSNPGNSKKLLGHRAERFDAWMHPFDTSIPATFQPRNSLLAIGSGSVLGRGFCASRQKWNYLPAPHNDYILAIIAEELGFVFTIIFLFVPYLFMLFRGFTVANRAPDEYGALIAVGCTIMFGVQALVNMAVVTNLMPCMGINLPFISYGGTSLIANMMLAGLLLNVSSTRTGSKRLVAPTSQTVKGSLDNAK